jgi:hypothetical protein
MTARRRPELLLHKAVAAYLHAVLPLRSFWTTFPAGGGGAIRGATLKAQGLRPGVPDVCIIHDGRAYWLELKAPKGKTSPQQDTTIALLEHAGSPTAICRSIDDVRDALALWQIPTIESKRRAA